MQKERKKERKREREEEEEEEEEEKEEEMEMEAQDLKPSTRAEVTHADLKPTHPWSYADLKPPTPIFDFLSTILPHCIDHANIEVSDAAAPTPHFGETRLLQVKAILLSLSSVDIFELFEDFSSC